MVAASRRATGRAPPAGRRGIRPEHDLPLASPRQAMGRLHPRSVVCLTSSGACVWLA